jgi:hypothetical protein
MTTVLDPFQLKQLLQDVEAKDMDRKEVSLLNICNDDKRLYGTKGSDIRRAYQLKFNYIKGWPIDRYIDCLELHGVAPSATTLRLLRLTPEANEEVPTVEEATSPSNMEDEDPGEDIEDAFGGLSIQDDDDYEEEASTSIVFASPVRKTRTTPTRTPTRTPNLAGTDYKRTPGRTPRTPMSPPKYRSPSLAESSISTFTYSSVTNGREDGTKKNPYTVFVDPSHPERNREFDIERVGKIKHNGYEYNGYHVRTPIAVPDYIHWKAFIPTELPRHLRGKFIKRAMLVKGPAHNFWIRNPTRYHMKQSCLQTSASHTGTQLEIEQDTDRFYSWYLLLWVNCVVLDNQVFSTHPTEVEKKLVAMECEVTDDDNETGKHLYGMAVCWRIAEKYGSRQVEDTKAKVDAKKLFD